MAQCIRQIAPQARVDPLLVVTAAVCCCAVAVLAPARGDAATQFKYGSFSGAAVKFVNVSEASGDATPLFGEPIVSGNSLDFNPLGYSASSANGGADSTLGNLTFGIEVAKKNSPFRIDGVTLAEVGDTTLLGNVPPGSMATASAVFASGVLDIYEVDFDPINHISVPFSLTFSPSGGTYFLGTDGGGGPIFNTQFSGSATLPVENILIANGLTGGATRVSVALNNHLNAVSELGTSALMSKSDFGVTVNNPEPTAAAGAALLLGGWTMIRRRRQETRG